MIPLHGRPAVFIGLYGLFCFAYAQDRPVSEIPDSAAGRVLCEPCPGEEAVLELAPAEVKGRGRPRPPLRTDVSRPVQRLHAPDLARSVSTFGDPSRIVQTLPGVARTNDWHNALVVRGGEPNQTVFLVGEVPLSRVSHYEGQHNDHGGIGILNLEYAESLALHKGPFPAHLPDRMSGIVDIDFRDGDTSFYRSRLITDVTGVGSSLEGPLAMTGGRGSFASVFRYSALDLLVRSGMVDALGAPRFFNGQMRLYMPMRESALRINFLGGGEHWRTGIQDQAVIDAAGHSFSGDVTWVRPSPAGRTRASAYFQDHGQSLDFRSLDGLPRPGMEGFSHREDAAGRIYGLALDQEVAAWGRWRLQAGTSQRLLMDGEYGLAYQGQAMYIPQADTSIDYSMSIRPPSRPGLESAVYGEAGWEGETWEFYAGYRHFYEGLSQNHGFGPRLRIAFRPSQRQTLQGALGLHTQAHDYSDLSLRADPLQARLPYSAQASIQWGCHLPWESELFLESFAKEGFRLPRRRMDWASGGFSPVWVDTGHTRSLGWEAGIRKPFGKKASFSAAYSYLWHREMNAGMQWEPGLFSVPHNFNASGEFALVRGFFLGGRYAAASGTPYFRYRPDAAISARAGVNDPSGPYAAAGKPYSRLDVRLRMEKPVGGASLVVFAEIENVLDRRNEFERRWNPMTNEESVMKGMGRIPMMGLSVGF